MSESAIFGLVHHSKQRDRARKERDQSFIVRVFFLEDILAIVAMTSPGQR
jgi:hypothetical protein